MKYIFRPPGTVVPGRPYVLQQFFFFFTHESSYCFQRVLAIVRPSVRHTGGSVKSCAS